MHLLQSVASELETDPAALTKAEDRLYALRDVARKHGVEVDALPALRDRLAERLAAIDDSGERMATLEAATKAAREAYATAAGRLSEARRKAASRIDKAVGTELPPLKLDKARFATRIEELPESQWGPQGMDRVAFEVATNPGQAPGPINKIASGGELSRFMLAVKVVLSQVSPVPTLVFDEVDSGVGGATADAVGERLARLGDGLQVLVVTHSPQVAARGRAASARGKARRARQHDHHRRPAERPGPARGDRPHAVRRADHRRGARRREPPDGQLLRA